MTEAKTKSPADSIGKKSYAPSGGAGRWQFRDREDLVDYVAGAFGIEPVSPGIFRASGAQLRASPPELNLRDRRVLFDDPILDLITSTDGVIEVGGVHYDMRNGFLHDRGNTGGLAAFDSNCVQHPPSGFERCDSDDGTTIVYHSSTSSITFKTFDSSNWVRWKIGAKITTDGPDFEAAQIDSRYFLPTVGQACTAINRMDADANDDFLDESEWGIFAEKPTRIAALCRAQWNGRRISGIVSRGGECFATGVTPFPDGYPNDWPPLQPVPPAGEVSIDPRSLVLFSRPERPTDTKSIRISNSHTEPKVVTVGSVETNDPGNLPVIPTQGVFSNTSGQFTVPSNGSVQITVSFTGQSGIGSLNAQIPISWDGRLVNVSLTGKLLQVIGP